MKKLMVAIVLALSLASCIGPKPTPQASNVPQLIQTVGDVYAARHASPAGK